MRKIVLMISRIVLTLFARRALGFAWKRLVSLLIATTIHDKGGAMIRFKRQFALALLFVISLLPSALAQPTNAPRGTICITSQNWCQAVQPGPPGALCACPTPTGWVSGVLR